MFPAMYSDLYIFVFFHFCKELGFRNGRKTGSVICTSEKIKKKCQQRYQSILLQLKSWSSRGASRHSAFKGSRPTIGHMLLALPAQSMSSPSRKSERGVSPCLHLIVFMFNVNQEN